MALGALGYVGYGVEVTEGTAVAPTLYLPVSSFSFEDTNDFSVPDQIRYGRDRSVAMASPYSVSGSMEMELIPTDIGPLLKSVFACANTNIASSAYAGGGYQHIFTPGKGEPTLTFESSAAGILVMRYSGVRVNTMELKAAFGEIVTASFGLEGLNRAKQGAESTPTYTDVLPYHFSGASVLFDSVANANVKDFTFSVGNNGDRVGTLRKTRAWKRQQLGFRDVGLGMTLDFVDTAEYDKFLAGTTMDVTIHLEAGYISGSSGPKHTLVIDIPNVMYNKAGVPLSAGDHLEQSVECLITKPRSGAKLDVFTATWITDKDATGAKLS